MLLLYCTRQGQKEADCRLKEDAERLRKERWSQKASAQIARANLGGYSDEVVLHGLQLITGMPSSFSFLL